MGRKRKGDDPLGLAGTRLAFRSGAFYYRHRDGRWERIGTDIAHAKKRAALYNDPSGNYGTMGYWLDMFIADCEARVKAKDLAQRTLSDYTDNAELLKVFFGGMLPEDIQPKDVQAYLIMQARAERPVRGNREIACLSSCISWLIRTGRTQAQVNPCMQKSGIQSNSETKRERYVTHDEYRDVYEAAGTPVRLLMELTYRTLQRPESDIIYWTPANLGRDVHTGVRVIKHKQNKTGVDLKIRLTADLDALILKATGVVPYLTQPLVHNRKGEGYTYDGILTNLRKAIIRANKNRAAKGIAPMDHFGYRDLKGKGATDMWRAKIPIEQIQLLCGHADKATTEKYIKARWSETADPNEVAMAR